jgi:pyruvate/2-oxoglutarate dehydrogenase complex dihydrolipoamide acyltransferase (E2) component
MPVLQSPKDKGRQVRVDEKETSRIQILKEGGWYEVKEPVLVENPAPEGAGVFVPPAPPENTEVDATEAARELAPERGIDLSKIQGTGAEGRVTKADVEAASAAPKGDSA